MFCPESELDVDPNFSSASCPIQFSRSSLQTGFLQPLWAAQVMTRFSIEFFLPYEKYFSFNWLQESIKIDEYLTNYEFFVKSQKTKIIIEGSNNLNYITELPNKVEIYHGTMILSYSTENVRPLACKIIQFTFDVDLFGMLLRPIIFMLLITAICSIYILIIKTRRETSDISEFAKDYIPINEIREVCSLLEEKNALVLEIRKAEEDAKRKKIAKKTYKNLISKNNSKIEEINKEIIPFKKLLMEANPIFEEIMKKLDDLEAERVSIKDALNLLEARYKRGKLPSRASYIKLTNDYLRRRKKIDRNIDKNIQQLRSYLL